MARSMWTTLTMVSTMVWVVPLAACDADTLEAERALYEEHCVACHTADEFSVGPNHQEVYGAKAATQPGYAYSPQMQQSGLTWDRETLSEFLKNPDKLVPGTSMGFDGLESDEQRQLIIDYLVRMKEGTVKAGWSD